MNFSQVWNLTSGSDLNNVSKSDSEIFPHTFVHSDFSFLQLVINESVEVRSLKVYVTPQFVQEFLDLFDSEESVERDYLKNILHKLYAKVSHPLDNFSRRTHD